MTGMSCVCARRISISCSVSYPPILRPFASLAQSAFNLVFSPSDFPFGVRCPLCRSKAHTQRASGMGRRIQPYVNSAINFAKFIAIFTFYTVWNTTLLLFLSLVFCFQFASPNYVCLGFGCGHQGGSQYKLNQLDCVSIVPSIWGGASDAIF